VITIASKIITYTDVDPKESSQFILFVFDIFVSKGQKFFSKKHYENVLIISFLIASQLKMRVTEEGRMEFANPEISNHMLEQLDTRFQKKVSCFH
jgi:hypothetical protein